MKKNTFYLVVGCIALALLAILIIYALRRTVTDIIEDERTAKISEQAALKTFQVFWVIFCALSIGAVMQILYIPTFSREDIPVRPHEIAGPRIMGYFQLGLLCLTDEE